MALRLRRGTDTERQLITPLEGELIYVTDTKELYAGDGSTTGGIRISGEVVDTLNQLDDVDAALPQDGDVLVYDSITGDWIASELPIGDLSNVDTTGITDGQLLAWDADTLSFVAIDPLDVTTFFGDVIGSVFADDSTLLVDGVTGQITANRFAVDPGADGTKFFNVNSGNRPELRIEHIKFDGDTNMQSTQGAIRFQALENDGTTTETAYIAAGTLGVFIVNDRQLDGSFGEENTITLSANGIGYKTYTPQEGLDIRGNGVFTGTITAASFTGSVATDDSTTIIDAIDGSISAQSFVQFGSLTTTERNALTAANGMVIYNTTDNKFQGYENGAWVNLV